MRGYTERTKKLREISTTTQPSISLERAVLETEFYEKYYGTVETPVLRALNFKNYMEKRKLYIGEGELIVGEKSEGPQVAPTFPELCCHTLEDMTVMNDRKYISFKVKEEDKKVQEEKIIPYWEKRSMRHKILESMTQEWKDCYAAGMFTEFMEQRAPGHTVADGKIYEKGLLDFKREIEEEIGKLDFLNDPDACDKKAQLEGMAISCDAIIIYGKRYAQYARELASKETDPKRKEELLWIANNCDVVPAHKPQTLAQALQMYWFVHIGVTTELNTWDSFSPGRLDQYIYPFYKKEKEEGTIDYHKARELLECLWIKFNNQPAPPKVGITLKESGTYTDFANINDRLSVLYSRGETYFRQNFLKDQHEGGKILLKAPLKEGNSWDYDENTKAVITGLSKEVVTPLGNYEAVEVTLESDKGKTVNYYAKDVGLVKTVSSGEGYEVSSTLSSVEKNVPLIQTITLFYPNAEASIDAVDVQIEFNTNDEPLDVIEKVVKDLSLHELLSPNTKINELYFNEEENSVHIDLSEDFIREMNAGASFEAAMLQSLANTLGNYYGVGEVYLTIDGGPYESGHILIREGEPLTVK
jgi:hypothetical protein